MITRLAAALGNQNGERLSAWPIRVLGNDRVMTGGIPEAIAVKAALRNDLNFCEKFGAGDGIRTHDPNLGKVVLYP